MTRYLIATASVLTSLALLPLPAAQAGCGCDKPAPPPASVRPHATYPGAEMTIFHSQLEVGSTYRVYFKSSAGEKVTVDVTAGERRDLADGTPKPQLVVSAPALSPGPMSIAVRGGNVKFEISDTKFTLVPSPLAVPSDIGPGEFSGMQAAVSRSGVVYLSLDLTGIHQPRIFEVQLLGYPLRFTADDVLFYNRQGFLMQTLGAGMPGLFQISAPAGSTDSDILKYSRHEFNTYFLQHEEREEHNVDPSDPNWHLDGTPHIDHDHLVVAIIGSVGDATPTPGATPSFNVSFDTYTLFHHGLVGDSDVTVSGQASTQSYRSTDGTTGSRGDVRSNGVVSVLEQSLVAGNAAGTMVTVDATATVTGATTMVGADLAFLPVDVPSNLTELGAVNVTATAPLTLTRGAYRASELVVDSDATLLIDNAKGPVTIYVEGMVVVGGSIQSTDANPENLALYVAGGHPVVLNNDAVFSGVVYAPGSLVDVSGLGIFHGAFVGGSVAASAEAAVHFDSALRGAHQTPEPEILDYPLDLPYDPMPPEYLM